MGTIRIGVAQVAQIGDLEANFRKVMEYLERAG